MLKKISNFAFIFKNVSLDQTRPQGKNDNTFAAFMRSERHMTNRYLRLSFEGAAYGFPAGMLIWAALYFIYDAQVSSAKNELIGSVIVIDYLKFPIDFTAFCILCLFLGLLSRLVIGFFVPERVDTFLGWSLTGSVLVIAANIVVLAGPVDIFPSSVGYGKLCCLNDGSWYLTLFTTGVIIAVFTLVFVPVRNIFQVSGRYAVNGEAAQTER